MNQPVAPFNANATGVGVVRADAARNEKKLRWCSSA
jgi:hypothetical protein